MADAEVTGISEAPASPDATAAVDPPIPEVLQHRPLANLGDLDAGEQRRLIQLEERERGQVLNLELNVRCWPIAD